jgi:site-specific DNA-methyltransferase (adenine-specific)
MARKLENRIICGSAKEVLQTMPAESINCCISSPPYWALRDYGVEGQLGLEKTFEEYIDKLCGIYDEVKRVLRPDGTCWVNLGDTYNNVTPGGRDANRWPKQSRNDHTPNNRSMPANVKVKSLCLIPQRFAIEMVNWGWILRNVIIWAKPNPMPSSAKDRFTVDFEYVYFFTKQKRYFFEPIYEPYLTESNAERPRMGQGQNTQYEQKRSGVGWGNTRANDPSDKRNDSGTRIKNEASTPLGRNKRTVWTIPTQAYPDAHFATFPEKLVEPMILAGCPKEVCSSCGQGRRKVYENNSPNDKKQWPTGWGSRGYKGEKHIGAHTHEITERNFKCYTDCGCGAEWRPGIVLDPFWVRARLARSLPSTDATGSELNSNGSILQWQNAA